MIILDIVEAQAVIDRRLAQAPRLATQIFKAKYPGEIPLHQMAEAIKDAKRLSYAALYSYNPALRLENIQ